MNLFLQWQAHSFYSCTYTREVHMKERGIWELSRVLFWQMTSLTTLTNTDCTDKWPNHRCSCFIQLWLQPSLPPNCLLLSLSCGSAGQPVLCELFKQNDPVKLTLCVSMGYTTLTGFAWIRWPKLSYKLQQQQQNSHDPSRAGSWPCTASLGGCGETWEKNSLPPAFPSPPLPSNI